jgi:ABC-type uncharacterized transport system fused permease/ATPase subunit
VLIQNVENGLAMNDIKLCERKDKKRGSNMNQKRSENCLLVLLLIFVGVITGVNELLKFFNHWNEKFSKHLNQKLNERYTPTC